MFFDQVQPPHPSPPAPPGYPHISLPVAKTLNSISQMQSVLVKTALETPYNCGAICMWDIPFFLWHPTAEEPLEDCQPRFRTGVVPRVVGRKGTQGALVTLRAQSLQLLLASPMQQP